MAQSIAESRASVPVVVREQFGRAIAASKCHGCGRLAHAVETLEKAATTIPDLGTVLHDVRRVLVPRKYDCLGCDVRFPAIAANALSDAFPEFTQDGGLCPTCGASTVSRRLPVTRCPGRLIRPSFLESDSFDSPARLSTRPTVLFDKHSARAMVAWVNRRCRSSTIANALCGAIAAGLLFGREERSAKPLSPRARKRSSHLRAVVALTRHAALLRPP